MQKWLVCLQALAFTGCVAGVQLYRGPKLPESQVSVVFNQPGSGTLLLEVDGQPVAKGGSTAVVSVLPGDHKLVVGFSKTFPSGDTRTAEPQSIGIMTGPGSYYVVDAVKDGKPLAAAPVNDESQTWEIEVTDVTDAVKDGRWGQIRSAAGY